MKSSDIKAIHRTGKKKETKCRDIIVQFADKKTKDTFQKEKKKLSSCNDSQRRVYINDDLTEYRQKLLYDARQLVKRQKLKAAWSQFGNIIVLDNESGLKAVSNYDELRSVAGMNYIDAEYLDDAEPNIDSDKLSDNSLLSSDY